jgi:adenosylcobinamide-GDP ribazoletransferase
MISPVRDSADDAPNDRSVSAATRDGVRSSVAAELRAAITMLTRIPVRGETGAGTGAAAFGVVGGLLGLVGMIPLIGLGGAAAPIAAILAVAVIAVVSGAVHLDGLADTADALMAVGPDGAERARTDPSIGVGGVVALILVLTADVTALALVAIEAGALVAGLVCVVACAVSRVVPVVLARRTRERANATGLGGWFAARVTTRSGWIAIGTALLVLLAAGLSFGGNAGLTVAVAGGLGGLGGLVIGAGLVRARRQLDGDVLGATVELSFALTVIVAAVLIGSVR